MMATEPIPALLSPLVPLVAQDNKAALVDSNQVLNMPIPLPHHLSRGGKELLPADFRLRSGLESRNLTYLNGGVTIRVTAEE